MRRPDGHHLAELNIGRLIASPGDPRVAEFVAATERVNALAERMPGFVWRLTDALEKPLEAHDDRLVPNLSVWQSAAELEVFVWKTVHKQFYDRRADWFEILGAMHFVMWWVPEGHEPTLNEAMERLAHLEAHGDSDHAFGWTWLEDAKLWREARCGEGEAA
jgi:hypothetical protein